MPSLFLLNAHYLVVFSLSVFFYNTKTKMTAMRRQKERENCGLNENKATDLTSDQRMRSFARISLNEKVSLQYFVPIKQMPC
ncbi:hypothetical protein EUGRSUZ_C02121 [Eucalyptus grandis]|uniref:Uncharacterized protein n=2 Tax=Eucalyptus grandis TaxID=71139 RepID=A0ACC3LEV6_EUCGR|nr:hypothetical protein EUGRSUZ_C02121 [Eucalyptus grandis]